MGINQSILRPCMCYDIKCSNVHKIVDIPGDDINADILCEQKRSTMLVPVPNEHCERNPSDSSGWTYSGMICVVNSFHATSVQMGSRSKFSNMMRTENDVCMLKYVPRYYHLFLQHLSQQICIQPQIVNLVIRGRTPWFTSNDFQNFRTMLNMCTETELQSVAPVELTACAGLGHGMRHKVSHCWNQGVRDCKEQFDLHTWSAARLRRHGSSPLTPHLSRATSG